MLQIIRAIKSKGPCDEARHALAAASCQLSNAGADLVLVACTEFSLIADSAVSGMRVVDTLDVLVSAIRDFSLATGNKGSQT